MEKVLIRKADGYDSDMARVEVVVNQFLQDGWTVRDYKFSSLRNDSNIETVFVFILEK